MKRISIIILLFVFIGSGHAQSPGTMPESYSNIPANFSTGAPSFSVPVWTARSGGLSLPVYLSYASNGVRAFDKPGIVGLGWNLHAGGSITQSIRGIVGENPEKFINDGSVAAGQNPEINEAKFNDYMGRVSRGTKDAEPDIFIYEMPGASGQFFFDSLNNIYTMVQNQLKIERKQVPDNDTIKDIFIITDGQGVVYTFGETQKTLYVQAGGVIKTSFTWLLTKITSPDNIDEINIEYLRSNYLSYGDAYVAVNNLSAYDTPITYYTEPLEEQVNVKSITTRNEKIDFHISEIDHTHAPFYNPIRPLKFPIEVIEDGTVEEIKIYARVLDSIIVKDLNEDLIKNFRFDFEYHGRRYLLTDIAEFGNNGGKLPPYQFLYYNAGDIPGEYSPSYDFWGYYNNNDDEEKLSDYYSRSPAPDKVQIGMLKTIKYPTGSHTTYEYEPNTYDFPAESDNGWYSMEWDNYLDSVDRVMIGPGVRVSRITRYEGDTDTSPIVTDFDYTQDGKSSGRLSAYPILGYGYLLENTSNSGTSYFSKQVKSSNSFTIEPGFVTYKKVTVYNGGRINGTNHGTNGKIEYHFQTAPPVEYTLENPLGLPIFPYELKLFPKDFNGRLMEKYVYDKESKIKLSESYEYANNIVAPHFAEGLKAALNKITVSPIGNVEYIYTSRVYKIYQKDIKLTKTTSRTYIDGDINNYLETVANYSYTRGTETLLVPTEISTTESNGDVLLTRLYYPADFQTDPACLKMLDRNIVSPVIKKETFKNAQQLSGSNTILGLEVNSGNDTLIVAKQSQLWINGAFETQTWFDVYDLTNGNLLQMHGRDNIPSTTLYAYHGTLPVASIANLNHASTASLLGAGNVALLRDSYNTADIESTLTSLRTLLNNTYPQAYISTGTYKPLVGKLKATDTNGRFVTYGYDEFGRQLWIKDQNGVIKKYNTYNLIK